MRGKAEGEVPNKAEKLRKKAVRYCFVMFHSIFKSSSSALMRIMLSVCSKMI